MLFTLAKNQLYAKDGDVKYVARPRITKRILKNEVIEKISYSCTLTDVDIGAVLTALEKALVEYVAMGCSVDLGFLTVRYSIRGGFNSETEGFQKDRNWVVARAALSNSFSNAVNQAAKPEKIKSDSKAPYPVSIAKVVGDMKSNDFKVGNTARLSGYKLTFDETDVETGIFLQPVTGNIVRVSEYGKICDTSVAMKMPDCLAPGKIAIEVRTRSFDGKIMNGVMTEPVVIAA